MSGLLLLPSKTRPEQFQHNAPIDYEGLGKGVQILINPALGPIDVATGRVWAANGDARTESGTRGKVFRLDGAGDYYTHTGYPEITGNVGTFFIWCPVVGPRSINGQVFLSATSPIANYVMFDASGFFYAFGRVSSGKQPVWYETTNRSLVAASGGTAATIKAYFDGVASPITFGSSSPVAWGTGNKNFRLGGYPTAASWDFNGAIRLVGLTTAVWGEAEARAFHENPWQIFKASKRRLFPVSSGSTEHDLTATGATQANACSTAAISQIHVLTAAALTSANSAGTAAITQTHVLAGAACSQTNTASATAIAQAHALTVQGATQANTASDAAVTIGASVNLVIDASAQANAASAATISQTHVLVCAPSVQDNIAASSAIVQAHILTAAIATQENAAGTGAITLIGSNDLTVDSATQGNIAGTGQITRTQTLTVASATQANLASSGAISDGVIVEPALTTGTATTIRIKKPGIPTGTPDWLKTFLEIIVGRRGNKITPPALQELTFSATPTKEECEALYSYANEIRSALNDIIIRLDS